MSIIERKRLLIPFLQWLFLFVFLLFDLSCVVDEARALSFLISQHGYISCLLISEDSNKNICRPIKEKAHPRF